MVHRIRGRHVGMIEDVVALCPEDQLDLFMQGLGLLEDNVGVDEAGALKLVAMDGDTLAKGRVGKGSHRGTDDLAFRHDLSTA